MWLTLATLAFAADPGPLVPGTGARSVKIDVFMFAPGLHPWGSDWKVTQLETWTTVLHCEPAGGRIERCTFEDGVWWGAVIDGSDELHAMKLPAPGVLEFVWTPRGRLGTWDVQGDRSAFWTEASNTMLQMLFHRPDMVFKPDAQRGIGQDIEQTLTRLLAGGLEWELPKKGVADRPWSPSQTPWSGRMFTQGISSHRISLSVTSETDTSVMLALDGTVSETPPSGSVAIPAVQTRVVGAATWDRAAGKVTQAKIETLTASTSGPVVGHTRTITVVSPWKAGDEQTPAQMPEPTL